MTARARYIALATEFESMASQIAKFARDAIEEQTQRGLVVADSIREMSRALDQIARNARNLLTAAKRGDSIDLEDLRASYDRYLRTVEKIVGAIKRSLRIN